MLIRPAKYLNGTISVLGDKSISHRAAIIAAMAQGDTRIENYSTGADCASTLSCLRQLGVEIELVVNSVKIKGVGPTGFKAPDRALDCGNSGTTMRLMAGVLSGQNFESVLTGDDSLRKRPMKRIIEPLAQMGADIVSNDGTPPLTIRPVSRLKGIHYKVPTASAQVKSCVLLAGLNADGETRVTEDIVTRDHTERMLRGFGVDIQIEDHDAGRTIVVSGDSSLLHRKIQVPGDISSAAFFLIAAVCLPGSDLRVVDVGLNPTRTAIVEFLTSCGVKIAIENEKHSLGEPEGDLLIRQTSFSEQQPTVVIDGERTAELIDELPILGVFGSQLTNGLEVHDARELRVKETDRIAAVVENIRRMNAKVEEFDDGFRVGRSQLTGAEVDSFGDHRIAMAFAVAGLLAEGVTKIKNPECVDISFPGFFETLGSVVKR